MPNPPFKSSKCHETQTIIDDFRAAGSPERGLQGEAPGARSPQSCWECVWRRSCFSMGMSLIRIVILEFSQHFCSGISAESCVGFASQPWLQGPSCACQKSLNTGQELLPDDVWPFLYFIFGISSLGIPSWVSGMGAAALGSSGQFFPLSQTFPNPGELQTFPVAATEALGRRECAESVIKCGIWCWFSLFASGITLRSLPASALSSDIQEPLDGPNPCGSCRKPWKCSCPILGSWKGFVPSVPSLPLLRNHGIME